MKEQTPLQKNVDAMFGVNRPEAHAAAKCLTAPMGCGGPATEFDDQLSRKEYGISGFCQACQDKIFGGDDDAEYDDGAHEDFSDSDPDVGN